MILSRPAGCSVPLKDIISYRNSVVAMSAAQRYRALRKVRDIYSNEPSSDKDVFSLLSTVLV